MSTLRTYHVPIMVRDGQHGSEVAAALRRIAVVVAEIVGHEPITLTCLIQRLAQLRSADPSITPTELEIGSYLAGLGRQNIEM